MYHTETILEVEKIKTMMAEDAYTDAAKERIRELKPMMAVQEVKAAQRETSEARLILEKMGNPPLTAFEHMEECIQIVRAGGCLTAEQLDSVAVTLTGVKRLKDFLCNAKQLQIGLPYYEENLDTIEYAREEIRHQIRNGTIEDTATKTLKSIRMKITGMEESIRTKAETVIRNQKAYMSESFSTMRNGRVCVPVKKEYRQKVPGAVISQSSTGSTLFIEPAAVARQVDELELKRIEEENELHNILYTLTGIVGDAIEQLQQNKKMVEKLDFIFAKGKASLRYDGVEPVITTERKIKLINGRHPLLDKAICVPLDFELGSGIRGVVITGPNTGGKTVAIKTVGINGYMAQCGLHVACEKAELCLVNQILCDIGDGQNLSENLSTFSSHITNVLDILKRADQESLVIMDELGSGTDPTEGMGIAIAILKKLNESGAFYLATTHYPEVKNYAEQAAGVINARMMFDRETLKPLYQLEIGKAGESCALYIARKLGMPADMLKAAGEAAYGHCDTSIYEGAQAKELEQVHTVRLKKQKNKTAVQTSAKQFNLGDSVMVYPDKKIGIVCGTADDKGILRVQMPGGKIRVSHKRIKLHVPASQLYPDDYDFSIIFNTVEERKVRHDMERKYVAGAEIKLEE